MAWAVAQTCARLRGTIEPRTAGPIRYPCRTGSDSTAPFTREWEHRSDGAHEIKAKLTDSEGRVRYSDAVRVTIGG